MSLGLESTVSATERTVMRYRLAIWFLLMSGVVALGLGNNGVPPFFGAPNCLDGWNPADKSASVSVSGTCNNTASASTATEAGIRSVNSKNSGKLFFSTTLAGSSILSGDTGAGIANSSAVLATVGTNATNAFMFFDGSGNIFFNGSSTTKTLGGRALTDVICIAIDFTNSRGWMRANAGNWNGDAAANPATNTNGIDISAKFPSTAAFAVASFNPNVGTAAFVLDTSAAACGANAPTSGFSAWN